jgi:FkbM family methyltransferase
MFVSYSQNGEDIVLWRVLGSVAGGTYVDVGAGDPTIDSVTRAMYERGWSGVNVEPVPTYADALRRERPRDQTFQCCAGAEPSRTTLHIVRDTGLSTQLDEHLDEIRARHPDVDDLEVEVRRLDDLLDEVGLGERPIHFLKVDVEGVEEAVLRGIDLDRFRPWIIVVEATRPMSSEPTFDAWEHLLLEHGYRFCLFDGLNRFYLDEHHAELAAALSYPACVFDEPIRRGAEVLAENEALRGQVVNLLGEVQRLDATTREALARAEQLERELTARTDAISNAEGQLQSAVRDGLHWRTDLFRTRVESAAAVAAERHHARDLAARVEESQRHLERLDAFISAMAATVSWRITRPLRGVRRVQKALLRSSAPAASVAESVPEELEEKLPAVGRYDIRPHLAGLARRIDAICSLLAPGGPPSRDPTEAFTTLKSALQRSSIDSTAQGWLLAVAATGSYPTETEMRAVARTLRAKGPEGVVRLLEQRFTEELAERGELPDLDIVDGLVLIDVSHTAMYDLHTGIQRVVRECASRWLAQPVTDLIHWDHRDRSAKRLHERERHRLLHWRDHMHAPGERVAARQTEDRDGSTLVPWNCTVLVPELIDASSRSAAYAALAQSGVIRRLSMIGYDLIPMTAAETVTEGMTATFGGYLSMLKHASRVSAISSSAATEFEGFNSALSAQGLTGPVVTSTPLPSAPTIVSPEQIAAVRDSFALTSMPLVLVVGSHEPRKNHLVLLEAAESLWNAGRWFELLLVGGASWGRPDFRSYVDDLKGQGRPVQVHERISEEALWSLYRLARFSVFTSLIEGYGLPVAESLSCGTPVITTDYGSMAEIASGGGAVVVDPRDVNALRLAMDELLRDDQRLAELERAAVGREWLRWDEYAARVWADLVER